MGATTASQLFERSLRTRIGLLDALNLRGDRYQDTGVSSAGTDTGGSIRIPAAKKGLFDLRPSFGALSKEGVMAEDSYFDAVGYHSRSPYLLRTLDKEWLGDSKQLTTRYTNFPHKSIMPSHL
ncbi:hypothetical protein HD806DRAFT_528508 [Xylariaceae sp. AK1471]|nr:hypothetical protein HD806DRAFT_528508 [Xylariaceae sp. AK1471]